MPLIGNESFLVVEDAEGQSQVVLADLIALVQSIISGG